MPWMPQVAAREKARLVYVYDLGGVNRAFKRVRKP